jgi:hypothetical protein
MPPDSEGDPVLRRRRREASDIVHKELGAEYQPQYLIIRVVERLNRDLVSAESAQAN